MEHIKVKESKKNDFLFEEYISQEIELPENLKLQICHYLKHIKAYAFIDLNAKYDFQNSWLVYGDQ